MQFGVVTLMPELMQAFLDAGVIGRAVRNGSINVQLENPRDYTGDAHRTVDDRPFGGGPGMVMKAAPLIQAIDVAVKAMPDAQVVYLSPQGAALQQRQVRSWQAQGSLILVAGRYEGIDERVITERIDAEVSIGDYVLSGGEIPAMAVIDAVSRLVPGVLGHPDSASQDSFGDDGLLDCPHYTRPEQFGELSVPQVLLSGDHKAIASWRRKMAVTRTWERRPELLETAALGPSDKQVLKQLESALESARAPGRSVADKQGIK